jgi:hypothetical integral membrane protein (TIGR02206 family)
MPVSLLSPAYASSILLATAGGGGLCVAARRHPGPWTRQASRAISVILAAEMLTWQGTAVVHRTWSVHTDLPFDLCDMTLLIAVAACWTWRPLLVELTYFWGLAGTLQAVLTPELYTPFPHLAFLDYVVEHLGIVVAAVYLVVGVGIIPRRRAPAEVFAVTLGYTGFVGAVDAVTGSNYMFLRSPPSTWSLLTVLGPWPWYLVSAGAIAVVIFAVLDAPFWSHRSAAPPVARPAASVEGHGP